MRDDGWLAFHRERQRFILDLQSRIDVVAALSWIWGAHAAVRCVQVALRSHANGRRWSPITLMQLAQAANAFQPDEVLVHQEVGALMNERVALGSHLAAYFAERDSRELAVGRLLDITGGQPTTTLLSR